MNKSPFISVLIPVFNREKYLGRCLRSLISQTIERNFFEIITINDGSTDKTDTILKSFADEIIIINKKKNSGLSSALNAGIKKSKGKYIVRVDSDDYVNKEFLKILYLLIDSNPDKDGYACDYFKVKENEKIIARLNCAKNPIACGIIFRAQQLKKIGMYNTKIFIDEEVDLRKRFDQKYLIERIALPLYRYRQHKDNLTKKR